MKKYNVYKILTIAILVTIVLSYFIPGTTISYGSVEKGTILPATFADTFINGLTSFSAFMTILIYVLVIGIFYAILKKSGKYETIVNNIAYGFKKNRSLFLVLVTLILSLVTMFTGEMYTLLIFVPLIISVIRKLGYTKETSILVTIGSLLIGNASALNSYYINQMLSVTIEDTILQRIVIFAVSIVFLLAFALIFDKKPESVKELEKKKEKKLLPIYIMLIIIFVMLVLGFVDWNTYFGFTGFDTFLQNIRSFQIANVSVFDIIIGTSSSIVPFGTWQVYHASILFMFASIVIALINKIKINDLFESVAEGLKKSFPYALIVILANIVLVNVFSSGIFYTIAMSITKTTVDMTTGTVTSLISALVYPDYAYATQFTLTSILNSAASDYETLISVLFQAVYSITLFVSPTSVLLLMALKYNNVSYKEWIKYIYKFFIVLLVTVLIVITFLVEQIDALSIIALLLLIIALIIMFYKKFFVNKLQNKTVKEETKVEIEEPKNVETKKEVKKQTTKSATKTTAKKGTSSKSKAKSKK